ncbi:LCP family protein [Schaalia vaccimaxillae]|uniref:LCP family protein n=1 Tax=Schaalia vaccimaxillae TaxID=183916 RepID=UPI0003B59861|nr:LCP family protein [Schaalia vaccimaxillae]
MSTNPPSFTPDPQRRRPQAGGAHKTASPDGHHDGPPTGGRIPKATAPQAKESQDHGRSAASASRHPQARLTPEVPQPQQWYVGEDDGPDAKPLNPTTQDQPNDVPPSFIPGLRKARTTRVSRDQPSQPQEQMPPAFAPQRRQAPPSYAPESVQRSASAQPHVSSRKTPAPRPASSQHPRTAPAPECSVPAQTSPARKPRRQSKNRPLRRFIIALVVLIVAWVSFLLWDANSNLGRTTALSGAAGTEGTTYLLAGSDSRADGAVQDGFEDSARTDSIMLVNVAKNGQATAVSIPRDTFAEIPGYGWDKINASYAYGGPSLLVETVEHLTGLTVDHYIEVGMGGVSNLVDAVGGVELCYDGDVANDMSGLEWTAGCHTVGGATALAFSRMRYSDPEGDIGRSKRQRQVISKVISSTLSPSTIINPAKTLKVERAGSKSFTVDEDSSIFNVTQMVLAFRKASNAELNGVPPIESLAYTTASGGAAVLLQDTTAPDFFARLRSGELTQADFE